MSFNVMPILFKDGYKVGHREQYPPNTEMVYSNFTPRGSRTDDTEIVAFGFQYFVEEFLMDQFKRNFFDLPREEVLMKYSRRIGNYLGPISVEHIGELWDVGYLPLKIKAVPEGTLVPLRVPMLTIRNTDPKFFWLTNMIETLLSNTCWKPCTSATTAFSYRKVFEEFADKTGADTEFIPWQGHDFSFRGLSGIDDALKSGAAHLLSFTGTDTIPAIDLLEYFYGANSDEELVGGSVTATEHSVMCMGGQEDEIATIERLMETYPTGILSVVSDTWDFWKVLTEYLPIVKHQIMSRDGKYVVRPDSGDPVKIICGDPDETANKAAYDGAIQTLWNTFGGTINAKGYKELDPHIGLIYGDSITRERQREILQGLMDNGFASSNVVLGIGSYTYQYVTRDTHEFAVKGTYGEINGKGVPISKNPVTDKGIKRSALGLLYVGTDANGVIKCEENVSWEREEQGMLKTIFEDGAVYNVQTLGDIRTRLENEL